LLKLAIFVVVSAVFATISRASLLAPRSHGFYRFFAWECILGLFLLNVEVWFRDPFSATQIVSWLLLIVSAFLVIHGVRLLRRIGQPDDTREEAPLLAFEKTTTLVVEGAYRYIRHPLYSSLLFLAWGIFFKDMTSWAGIGLAAAATFFLTLTAKAEESEDIRFFGTAYRDYMRRTRMFIPFLF
jgi:protein-S-isoprenylcysteine O-methyltransferase Ste14